MVMRFLTLMFFLGATLAVAEPDAPEAPCQAPTPVKVPDGANASLEEMRIAQRQVQNAVTETQAYLQCLLQLEKAEQGLSSAQQKQSVRDYNLAVEQLRTLVARFNRELGSYRQTQPR